MPLIVMENCQNGKKHMKDYGDKKTRNNIPSVRARLAAEEFLLSTWKPREEE